MPDEVPDFVKRTFKTFGIQAPEATDDRIASEKAAIEQGATSLGVDPKDYATAISYESAKSFDPWKAGPVTQYGQHRGTIQYGEPQQKQYGVHQGQSFEDQVTTSNVKYLKDHGVKPGMTFAQIYAAIDGGRADRAQNTLEPTTRRTIGDNVKNAERDHRDFVLKRYGWNDGTPELPDFAKRTLGLAGTPQTSEVPDFVKRTFQTFKIDPLQPNVADQGVSSAQTNNAVGVDRATPIPEHPETIDAQMTSMMRPDSPKIATLITPGEMMPAEFDSRTMGRFVTPQGTWFVNLAKAKKEKVRDAAHIQTILEKNPVVPNKWRGGVDFVTDTSKGTAMHTVDPATGRELTSNIVMSPESAQVQAQVDQAAFPGSQSHIVDAQDVVAARLPELESATHPYPTDAQMNELQQAGEAVRGVPALAQSSTMRPTSEPPQTQGANASVDQKTSKSGPAVDTAQNKAIKAPQTRSIAPTGIIGSAEGQNEGLPTATSAPQATGPDTAEGYHDYLTATGKQATKQTLAEYKSALEQNKDFGHVGDVSATVDSPQTTAPSTQLDDSRAAEIPTPVKGANKSESDDEIITGSDSFTVNLDGVKDEDKQRVIETQALIKAGRKYGATDEQIQRYLATNPGLEESDAAKAKGNVTVEVPRHVISDMIGGPADILKTVKSGLREKTHDVYVPARDANEQRDKDFIPGYQNSLEGNPGEDPLLTQARQNVKTSALGIQGGDYENDVKAEYERLKKNSLTDEEKYQAQYHADNMEGLSGAAESGAYDFAGKSLESIAGLFNTLGSTGALGKALDLPENAIPESWRLAISHKGQEMSEAGRLEAERHKDTEGILNKGVRLGVGLAGHSLRYLLLSRLPGGMTTMFGVDAGLQSAGRGDRPEEVAGEVAKGAVTGLIFGGATKLSRLFEAGTLNKILSGVQIGNKTLLASRGSQRLAGQVFGIGTKIGSVLGGTATEARISGQSPADSLEAGITNSILILALEHGGDVLAGVKKLAGKIFRGKMGGETKTVTVDENGDIHELKKEVPDEAVDVNLAIAPKPVARESRTTESAKNPITGFRTAKGSTYAVDGQSTTRDKSYHPEHGTEDVGVKKPSDTTYYGDEKTVQSLGLGGIETPKGAKSVIRITENPDGTVNAESLYYNPVTKKWNKLDDGGTLSTTPEVGKHPLELWNKETEGGKIGYTKSHAGNKITELISKTIESPTAAPTPEKPAPEAKRRTAATEREAGGNAEKPKPLSSTQVEFSKEQVKPFSDFRSTVIDKNDIADKADLPPYAKDGINIEPHITLKYGLHTTNAADVEPILKGEKPIEVTLGKTGVFKGADKKIPGTDKPLPYDVVTVEVDSPDLARLNKKISDNAKVTDTFNEYKPHVTIAYVKAGMGEKYANRTDFEGQKFTFDGVKFSPADKSGKTQIPLTSDLEPVTPKTNISSEGKSPWQRTREEFHKSLSDYDRERLDRIDTGEERRVIYQPKDIQDRLERDNPVLKGRPDAVVLYRSTTGNKINPGDFVYLNQREALKHQKELGETGAQIKSREVPRSDLVLGQDTAEFIYSPTNVTEQTHRAIVSQAVKEGKSVPPAVLKDYPDLAAKETSEGKPLPPVKNNDLRPLSDYSPTLYRETNVDKAIDLFSGLSVDDKPFFANTQNLAKGQGKNTGVMIELDSEGLQGQVNTSKPGWELAYKNGEAEFVGKYNKSYRENIKSVTITEAAKTQKRVTALRNTLEQDGWGKELKPNGDIVLTRPVKEMSLPEKTKDISFNDFLKEKGYDGWYKSNVPVKRLDEAGKQRIKNSEYDRLQKEFDESPAGIAQQKKYVDAREAFTNKPADIAPSVKQSLTDLKPGDEVTNGNYTGKVFKDKTGVLRVERKTGQTHVLTEAWEKTGKQLSLEKRILKESKKTFTNTEGLKVGDTVSSEGNTGKIYTHGGKLRVRYEKDGSIKSEAVNDSWKKTEAKGLAVQPLSEVPPKPADWNPETGAVSKDLLTAVPRMIEAAHDYISVEPIPKLQEAELGEEARRHAAARIAVPHVVADLTAKIFPDQYLDPEAMARTADILNKDDILGGYYKFLDNAERARDVGDDIAADKWQRKAEAVGDAHDIDALQTEVEASQGDADIPQNIERWKKYYNALGNELYNKMKGVDPATPRDGRGAVYGARMNLLPENKAAEMRDFADLNQPMPAPIAANYRNPNVKRDQFDRAAKFTGNYSTDVQAILTNMIGGRMNETTKLDLYKAIEDKGVGVMVEPGDDAPTEINGQKAIRLAVKIPHTNAEGKTTTVERGLYVQQDIAREMRDVLNTEMKLTPNPVGQFLTQVQVAQLADMTAHLKNIHSVLAAAPATKSVFTDIARRFPGVGTVDAITRIAKVSKEVVSDTPKIREEIAEMAKLGLIRTKYPSTGIQKITKGQDLIHAVDTASRITMNRFFTKLAEAGRVEDTPQNRASFVQQIGEYNDRLMSPLMRAAKQSGLSPFIVAGRNFNRQGVRLITGAPGVKASSTTEAAKMRLANVAVTMGVTYVTLPAILNLFTTGSLGGRPGTPLGAWDMGYDEDDKGKHKILDFAQLLGIRRGLRRLGLNATIEGLREGKSAGEITDNAIKDVVSTELHPWLGPALGFAFQTLTGSRLDLRGGPIPAEARNMQGSGQYKENARVAFKNQNRFLYEIASPLIGTDEDNAEKGYLSRVFGEGLLKAPTSAAGLSDVQSPAMKLASEIQRAKGVFTKTPDQEKARATAKDLMTRADNGEDVDDEISKAVNDGVISERQVKNMTRNQGLSPLAAKVKYMGLLPDALRVWERAGIKERADIYAVLQKKINSGIKSGTLSDADQSTLKNLGFDVPPEKTITDKAYRGQTNSIVDLYQRSKGSLNDKQKAELKTILTDKANSAAKNGTLTDEELERVKSVIPDYVPRRRRMVSDKKANRAKEKFERKFPDLNVVP